MKVKMMMLVIGFLLIGNNLYAADGDLIVNGNVGIGIASAPVTRLDIVDYQFVKFGQAGIFLKNNAYINIPIKDDGGYTIVTGEAKNMNGVVYIRANCGTGRDSGWITGLSATCNYGSLYTTYTFRVSTKGLMQTAPSSAFSATNQVDW